MYRWLYLSPSDSLRKKLKFLGKPRSSKQIWDLSIAHVARLGSLKAFFRSLAKKYMYVVICHSDGPYNHLTYFEKKSKYDKRTTRNGARIRFYNPSTTCLSRCFARNIVKWGNSSQIDFVVRCTADCTCHHPTILERNWNFWVSREVLNKYGDLSIADVARLGHDSIGVKTSNASRIFCGSLLILLFSLKYVRWLYVPSQGHITTYRYFFAQEWKKPLKFPVERHLEWLNAYICFKLLSTLRNFNFSPELSDGDVYNQRYMSPRA